MDEWNPEWRRLCWLVRQSPSFDDSSHWAECSRTDFQIFFSCHAASLSLSLSLNRPPERAGCLNDGWWSSNPKAEPTTPLGTVSNLVCILPILTLL